MPPGRAVPAAPLGAMATAPDSALKRALSSSSACTTHYVTLGRRPPLRLTNPCTARKISVCRGRGPGVGEDSREEGKRLRSTRAGPASKCARAWVLPRRLRVLPARPGPCRPPRHSQRSLSFSLLGSPGFVTSSGRLHALPRQPSPGKPATSHS